MPFKFKQILLISVISTLGTAHAGDRNQDAFQVQVLKNASVFSNSNTMLSVDGESAKTTQYLRSDQVSVDCTGNAPKSMKSVERFRGTQIEARRDANIIKLSVSIKDVEPQILPTSIEKCVEIKANEQKSKQATVVFTVTDASKGEFSKDIGDGYSLVLKTARMMN